MYEGIQQAFGHRCILPERLRCQRKRNFFPIDWFEVCTRYEARWTLA